MSNVIRNVINRFRVAAAAFCNADVGSPRYAVIYDNWEDLDRSKDDPKEEFYEAFKTTDEAFELFRTAYPKDHNVVENPRLVLILGGIDRYQPSCPSFTGES